MVLGEDEEPSLCLYLDHLDNISTAAGMSVPAGLQSITADIQTNTILSSFWKTGLLPLAPGIVVSRPPRAEASPVYPHHSAQENRQPHHLPEAQVTVTSLGFLRALPTIRSLGRQPHILEWVILASDLWLGESLTGWNGVGRYFH